MILNFGEFNALYESHNSNDYYGNTSNDVYYLDLYEYADGSVIMEALLSIVGEYGQLSESDMANALDAMIMEYGYELNESEYSNYLDWLEDYAGLLDESYDEDYGYVYSLTSRGENALNENVFKGAYAGAKKYGAKLGGAIASPFAAARDHIGGQRELNNLYATRGAKNPNNLFQQGRDVVSGTWGSGAAGKTAVIGAGALGAAALGAGGYGIYKGVQALRRRKTEPEINAEIAAASNEGYNYVSDGYDIYDMNGNWVAEGSADHRNSPEVKAHLQRAAGEHEADMNARRKANMDEATAKRKAKEATKAKIKGAGTKALNFVKSGWNAATGGNKGQLAGAHA